MAVNDEVCTEVRKNIDKQFAIDEHRLNQHGSDITDLKLIMSQLTHLQATNTAQLTVMETRVKELEISKRNHQDDIRLVAEVPRPQTFLDSPSGLLVIKGTFVLAIVIVLAAVGQNVNPEFLASVFGK